MDHAHPSTDPGGGGLAASGGVMLTMPATSPRYPAQFQDLDGLQTLNAMRSSLSRSPSRRLMATRSTSSLSPRSPNSPLTPTSNLPGRSPLRHAASNLTPHASPRRRQHLSTQDDTALTPAGRRDRPQLRRTPHLRLVQPSPTPAKAPMRRALSTNSDNGNASNAPSSSSQETQLGQENFSQPSQPPATPNFSTPFTAKHHTGKIRISDRPPATVGPPLGLFAPPPPHHLQSIKSPGFRVKQPLAKSSPLKRSDEYMDLDPPELGSPSIKRRSLTYGRNSSEASRSSSDFSAEDESDDHDHDDLNCPPSSYKPAGKHSVRRRPNSLRRSKKFAGTPKVRRGMDPDVDSDPTLGFALPEPTVQFYTPVRPGVSPSFNGCEASTTPDDAPPSGFTPRKRDDTPIHPFSRSTRSGPHPLSRALDQSSPLALVGDHEEAPPPVMRMLQQTQHSALDFSKSLPIAAVRPNHAHQRLTRPHQLQQHEEHSQASEYSTPASMHSIRPEPHAFLSTGLISKRHRDPDDMPAPPGAMNMPDTPIKKNHTNFRFGETPGTNKPIAKLRFTQPQFGTPVNPFGLRTTTPAATTTPWGSSGSGIFGTAQSTLSRKASFLSSDGEDATNRSPLHPLQSKSSNDELPPTPTKNGPTTPAAKHNSLRSSILGRKVSAGPALFSAPDSAAEATIDAESSVFNRIQKSVTPVKKPPHTPLNNNDGTLPDPSGLSISAVTRQATSPKLIQSSSNESFHAPETPSTSRGIPFFVGTHHLMLTPTAQQDWRLPERQLDDSLLERFKHVEWLGKGAFSQVYKVWYPRDESSHVMNSLTSTSADDSNLSSQKTYVVKKSKAVLNGARLRERKLREVKAMQAIGKNDRLVEFIDSWEADGHLYIQTDFCEHGTLDGFLGRIGKTSRLDDFRIWKILLQLAEGLKHIHDAGYVHLDLKPENIFVSTLGELKIGDFGLASELPIPSNVDTEGDRRYMPPECMRGKPTKAADIFALGIIMFEIACNIEPPDNGHIWLKLRSSEFEGLPSMTSNEYQSLEAIALEGGVSDPALDDQMNDAPQHASIVDLKSLRQQQTLQIGIDRFGIFDSRTFRHAPPSFMIDKENPASLEHLVHWMLQKDPKQRPTIDQVLDFPAVQWVAARNRFGATIYEGFWGPKTVRADALPTANFEQDHEMMDVS